MAKGKGGFIGQDGLNAPDPATGVSATAGDAQATVAFTAPTDVGGSAITGYRAQSNDGIGASGSSSPITVTGLTNGTSYTFNVWAINPFGWSSPSDASGSVSPAGVIGLFMEKDYISKITISSTGNAVDYADPLYTYDGTSGAGNETYFTISGGTAPSNNIQYIGYTSGGTASSWGNLQTSRAYMQGAGNSTRGIINGGAAGSTRYTTTDYITYASTGSVSNFGNSSTAHGENGGSGVASTTRAIFAGGEYTQNNSTNVIEYCTIASTGSFSTFGNLASAEKLLSGCSSATRGLFAGGSANGASIHYVTIASTGNTSDFGDLTVSRFAPAGMASSTRGVFASGYSNNTIDYVTIASTGNATDFGDAQNTDGSLASSSNGHGGLS